MTDTTHHTPPQMIEVQPINSFADIPSEILIAMRIQLVFTVLAIWLAVKILKLTFRGAYFGVGIVRRKNVAPVADAAPSDDDEWADIRAKLKEENRNE